MIKVVVLLFLLLYFTGVITRRLVRVFIVAVLALLLVREVKKLDLFCDSSKSICRLKKTVSPRDCQNITSVKKYHKDHIK
ncbi:hypothetical protein KAH94_01540 [bacterium]|nr:hypothetical protein [bacterium]